MPTIIENPVHRLVVYTVFTILADFARPSLERIELVVGGSEAQPSEYLTEELSQSMSYYRTSGWAALLTLWPTPRPYVGPRAFPHSDCLGVRQREE